MSDPEKEKTDEEVLAEFASQDIPDVTRIFHETEEPLYSLAEVEEAEKALVEMVKNKEIGEKFFKILGKVLKTGKQLFIT